MWVRFTPTVLPGLRVLVLVPLQAVRVERAGLNLAVPRGPQRVRQLNERRNVRSRSVGGRLAKAQERTRLPSRVHSRASSVVSLPWEHSF